MGLFKKLSDSRRNSRTRGMPNDGPFEIEISGDSATEAYNRGLNKEVQNDYNNELRQFWNEVASELRSSASLMVRENKFLSNSIRANVYKKDGEVNKLGFAFRREGVFLQKGVGRGYVMQGNTVVKTSSTPGFNRRQVLWFNPVIERNIPKLHEIVAKYYKDLTINTTRIYIK